MLQQIFRDRYDRSLCSGELKQRASRESGSRGMSMAGSRHTTSSLASSHFIVLVIINLMLHTDLINGRTIFGEQGEGEEVKNRAMQKLLQVFGLHDRPNLPPRHKTPPQYMMDLYNSIADSSGITRTTSPYDASVVRSFSDKDSTDHMHFYFNVSNLEKSERLIEAEFHLYKVKAKSAFEHLHPHSRGRRAHLCEIRLYQIMDPNKLHLEEGGKLLEIRRVSSYSIGWEVFYIKNAVLDWINDSSTNLGLLVTVRSYLSGEDLNSTLRFAKRREHHDSRQPILVLFTDDGKPRSHNFYSPSEDSDELGDEYTVLQNERRGVRPGTFRLAHMNERHRQLLYVSRNMTVVEKPREQRSTEFRNAHRPRRAECTRHELYVDFEKIGWSGWIISPKGYNAYHCKGECPFPLGQNQRPTNHATVQSIVHALKLDKDVHTPCCVPNKLYSISLLYFDDYENVILKQYDDMVASSCGCH